MPVGKVAVAQMERDWIAVGGAAGARLVTQPEYGWWRSLSAVGGANGARRERGHSAVRAQPKRGRKDRNGWGKKIAGAGGAPAII